MSFLTLAPLYRSIYYGLLSRFNRWSVFLGIVLFILAVVILTQWQRGINLIVDRSEYQEMKLNVATTDGYYRDKNPEKISNWMHINSAQVDSDVLEVFVVHKAALEDSLLVNFGKSYALSREEILQSDSLKLQALSHFYRFKIDGQWVDPVPLVLMNYSEYNQRGMLSFIPIENLSKGMHKLELWVNWSKPTQFSNVVFYKVNSSERVQNTSSSELQ